MTTVNFFYQKKYFTGENDKEYYGMFMKDEVVQKINSNIFIWNLDMRVHYI